MLLVLACLLFCGDGRAAAPASRTNQAAPVQRASLPDAFSPAQWRRMEQSVDRALAWTAAQQAADGSFPTRPTGQPAVTSLSVMAFLSRGHQPGAGPYGASMDRAIDFVLSCQKEDGLFSFQVPEAAFVQRGSSQTASYNHAIAGLMLTEVYGQVAGPRAQQVKAAIARALLFTRQLQARPKAEVDKGGWRYLRLVTTTDSDISATAWQLMFLRSAKNAEFDVPPEPIQQAMAYVNRCWDPQSRMFNYGFENGAGYGASRGVTGAGIVCLAMGGQHQTPAALGAGDWLLAHPFQSAGEVIGTYDKFIYATYYCSQAAAQLGGRYWQGIYPPLVEALVNSQAPDGSWKPAADLAEFGEGLTTSMAVLSLTPAFQLLPVYQR